MRCVALETIENDAILPAEIYYLKSRRVGGVSVHKQHHRLGLARYRWHKTIPQPSVKNVGRDPTVWSNVEAGFFKACQQVEIWPPAVWENNQRRDVMASGRAAGNNGHAVLGVAG